MSANEQDIFDAYEEALQTCNFLRQANKTKDEEIERLRRENAELKESANQIGADAIYDAAMYFMSKLDRYTLTCSQLNEYAQ